MEEPELRVGGWVQQKKRGKVRRLFSFLLIIESSFSFFLPSQAHNDRKASVYKINFFNYLGFFSML